MKEVNFIICVLIFMIGSLNLIRTEPYPTLDFSKPLLDKQRRLQEDENYMIIYLKEENNTFNFENNYKDYIKNIKSGETEISKDKLSSETKVSSKLRIFFSSPLQTLENFFKDVTNIVSVDLSHLNLSLVQSVQICLRIALYT